MSNEAIVLSNLIPLWGVLFRGWDVFAIMLLFWLENLVIGVFNACRIGSVRWCALARVVMTARWPTAHHSSPARTA